MQRLICVRIAPTFVLNNRDIVLSRSVGDCLQTSSSRVCVAVKTDLFHILANAGNGDCLVEVRHRTPTIHRGWNDEIGFVTGSGETGTGLRDGVAHGGSRPTLSDVVWFVYDVDAVGNEIVLGFEMVEEHEHELGVFVGMRVMLKSRPAEIDV